MANKPFDTKCSDLFWFSPDEIIVPTKGALADSRTALPVLETLVLDIMARGVDLPVIIRKNDKGKPELVDGRQRVKAAIEANRRLKGAGREQIKIPAVCRRGDDVDLYLLSLSANEHRQDDDPIAKAKKVVRLLGIGGTEADAAIAFGVTPATIKNWLAINELGPAAKSAVQDGKIKPTAALALAKLPHEKQNEKLVELLDKAPRKPDGTVRKPTVREARQAAASSPDTTGSPARKRMRGKPEIELAMAHHSAELKALDGITVLRWVLGHIEIEELNTAPTGATKTARAR